MVEENDKVRNWYLSNSNSWMKCEYVRSYSCVLVNSRVCPCSFSCILKNTIRNFLFIKTIKEMTPGEKDELSSVTLGRSMNEVNETRVYICPFS